MSWVRAAGVDLYVRAEGPPDGPLVLCLHGFPVGSRTWRLTLPALAAAGFRAVAPDQRGYGASGRPAGWRAYTKDRLVGDVIALADALGAETFSVVGHDFGGAVGWTVAREHPERVRRLAVLNCPEPEVFGHAIRHDPGQALRSAYIALFQPRLAEALLSVGRFRPARWLLARSARPGAFPPAEVDAIEADWRRPGAVRAMLDWYRAAVRGPSAPPAAVNVDVPTLLVWGLRDGALAPSLIAPSLAACRTGRLLCLPAAGHWPHLDDPAAVHAALVEFLA